MRACDSLSRQRREFVRYGVLLALVMVRNCAAGLAYWPQLDDYIQCHNYAAGFTFSQLQAVVGVLASRPLAGLADYYLWSPLFDRMILGVALMSLLYVAAICKAVRRGFLDRSYLRFARKGYEGIISRLKWDEKGIIIDGVCIGTGVGDYEHYLARPTSANDLHGMGAFILMCQEAEQVL